jgi:hypothetical protein
LHIWHFFWSQLWCAVLVFLLSIRILFYYYRVQKFWILSPYTSFFISFFIFISRCAQPFDLLQDATAHLTFFFIFMNISKNFQCSVMNCVVFVLFIAECHAFGFTTHLRNVELKKKCKQSPRKNVTKPKFPWMVPCKTVVTLVMTLCNWSKLCFSVSRRTWLKFWVTSSFPSTFKMNWNIYARCKIMGIVEILFLCGLDNLNSKYQLDRLIFKLCSSRLKVVFQVSYKPNVWANWSEFTYWASIKIKVLITCLVGLKLVYFVLEIACELVWRPKWCNG